MDALPLVRLTHLDASIHVARTFGAHHLQVQGDRPGTVAEAAATIGAIADRVADDGIGVSIEFVGCKNIATAADALELAELSGRPNVGVQADVWHLVRGANDWSQLEAIPGARLQSIQLDDGPRLPLDPDYLADTVHHRFVPGEGEFDLARFLTTLWATGARLPVSLEVIDDDLSVLPPSEAARRIGDATRALLASLDPPT